MEETSNTERPTSLPLNEENMRALGAGMAAVGPFMRQRAAELGERMGVQWTKMLAAMGDQRQEWKP